VTLLGAEAVKRGETVVLQGDDVLNGTGDVYAELTPEAGGRVKALVALGFATDWDEVEPPTRLGYPEELLQLHLDSAVLARVETLTSRTGGSSTKAGGQNPDPDRAHLAARYPLSILCSHRMVTRKTGAKSPYLGYGRVLRSDPQDPAGATTLLVEVLDLLILLAWAGTRDA
jgi:hypothetical protein